MRNNLVNREILIIITGSSKSEYVIFEVTDPLSVDLSCAFLAHHSSSPGGKVNANETFAGYQYKSVWHVASPLFLLLLKRTTTVYMQSRDREIKVVISHSHGCLRKDSHAISFSRPARHRRAHPLQVHPFEKNYLFRVLKCTYRVFKIFYLHS